MPEPTAQITMYLQRMRDGDGAAADQLLPLVYTELRAIAGQFLGSQRGHTLQPTALVHEAWLKIQKAQDGGASFADRRHFLAVAAKAMRQVLVNHARDRKAQKRGGGATKLPLDECLDAVEQASGNVVALADVLDRFASSHPRAAQVVEMRVFGGFTVEEVAEALDVAATTVKEDWRFARAWLQKALHVEPRPDDRTG